jgi:signal transduction histidine kinase/streptogramin lyase/ActR/RegA family two-component response regulator
MRKGMLGGGLALLLAAGWGSVRAEGPAFPQVPRLRMVGTSEGLPSTAVNMLARDRAGHLWLASNDGLARYDGLGFRVWRHDPADPASLAGNVVQAVLVDSRDRVWVASESAGLSLLDPASGRFRHFRQAEHPQMAGDDVYAIAEYRGEIWFGNAGGGLHRLDAAGRVHRYDLQPVFGGPVGHVMALAGDGAGRLWIGTLAGVAWYDGAGLHREALPMAETPGVVSLASIGDTLWMGAFDGVHYRDGQGRWHTPHWSAMFGGGNLAWAIAPAGGGQYWLGSERGLWLTGEEGAAPTPIRQPGGGQHDRAGHPLLATPQGELWASLYGRGLGYLGRDWRRVAVRQPPEDMGDGIFCGIAPADRPLQFWSVDPHGRLQRYDAAGHATMALPWQQRALGGIKLASSLQDRAGRLWLGSTGAGLLRLDLRDGTLAQWRIGDADNGAGAVAEWLVQDARGDLWLAGQNLVQRRAPDDGRVLTSFVLGKGLPSMDVDQLGVDAQGEVWLATGAGMLAWDPGAGRFAPVPEFGAGRVFAFAWAGDTLWFHRMDGLHGWRRIGNAWQPVADLGADEGLAAVEAAGLQVDPQGRVWLATRRGLLRIQPDAAPGRRVRRFSGRDGLASTEFVDGCLAMSKAGILSLGTADGDLLLVDTRQPDPAPWTPALTLEAAVPDPGGTLQALPDGGFELRPEQRNLQVAARLLAFADPAGNRFRSRLLGLDPGWIEQGHNPVREFAGLPPGRYRLQVQGVDPLGNASPVRELAFRVAPPWWRTPAAGGGLAGIGLLAVGGMAAGYRRRLRLRHEWRLAEHKREVAEQASQAKTRFLATLGHEVRTPMTGVLGMCELLLGTPLAPQQRRYADTIRAAGDHLLRLVNDALDLARIEAGKLSLQPADFDLAALVEQVAALSRPLATAKGLAFQVRMDPGLPPALHGDVSRVRQILLNLLGNAVKFTERGEVALRLSPALGEPGCGIRLEVADTGPGLDPAQQARLFRRFEQADGVALRHGGSGLGLAICRELAAAMGGAITLVSRPGDGSRFIVELPLPWARPADTDAAERRATPEPVPAARLLLVEDDPTVAEAITGLLRARGHGVVHAAHALAALAELRADAGFDALLCDLDLPGMDGFALARQVRALGHAMPLVAVTARSDAEVEAQARAGGFACFVRKPVTSEVLARALARVLAAAAAPAR